MARCEVCGAIHAMAPSCAHCGCKIVGHGMEAEGKFFCCAHCAQRAGAPPMRDRAEPRSAA